MGQRRNDVIERARNLPRMRSLADGLPIVQKAQGSRLYDVDNVGFIDFVGGGGTAIVGHANQYVLDSVKKAVSSGIPGGMHAPIEVDLAESLQFCLPWVGSWFYFKDDSEAFRRAVAWARHRTGRNHFLCLDGGSSFEMCCLDSGLLDGTIREVPGWRLDRIEAALAAGASKIAAVIIDPLMTGAGLIPAPDDVLTRIAQVCRNHDVLLILDERIAGFRVARGGAAEHAGVTPDAAIYGGGLGGGFPIGVLGVAGQVDPATIEHWAGKEPAPHLPSLAAAEAVLSILKNDSVFARLEDRSQQLVDGLIALGERFSRPLQINRLSSIFSLYVTSNPVVDQKSASACDWQAYRRLVGGLYSEGVLLPANPGVPAFVSSAHGGKDVEETLEAFERVLLRLHKEDLP